MLVLTRKRDESIVIGEDIEIIITEISEDKVKIGIKAPKSMKIFRRELLEEVKDENLHSIPTGSTNVEQLKSMIKLSKNK